MGKKNKNKKQAAPQQNGLGFIDKETPVTDGEEEKKNDPVEPKKPVEAGNSASENEMEFEPNDDMTQEQTHQSVTQTTCADESVPISDVDVEWTEVTSKNPGTTDTPEEAEEQKVELTAAEKKKKKRNNKKNNAKKKQVMKEFRDRCMSPEFDEIQGVKFQADIQINNLNTNYHANKSNTDYEQTSSQSDRSASSDEDLEDYQIEGYHPMHIDEIIDGKYIILKKLGWGHFSTVWLALKLQDKKLYALKVQKSADKYTESALEEQEILYDVAQNFKNLEWEKSMQYYLKDPHLEVGREHTQNLQMFDSFFHNAQNGMHSVMAFEVLGKNLLNLIKKYDYEGIPIPIVREITKQILVGLDYLHRICNIIHTDLKPENVTFGLLERQKFEMLYRNVLLTPLVDLYDHTDPILLNKKQQKNFKKNQRKKKKAAEKRQSTTGDAEGMKLRSGKVVGASPDDQNEETKDSQDEEEEKVEEQKEETKDTRTEAIIKVMRQELTKEEEEFKLAHVFKKTIRSISHERPINDSRHVTINDEPESDFYQPVQHPLHRDQVFIEKHVKTDFAKLKEKSKGDERAFQKLLKKVEPKRRMRVRSQESLYSSEKFAEELKPKGRTALRRVADMDFSIKLCDMGNACYIDKHYSDVIQTREYRSPEIILEGDYDESADMWSLACMVFELITGDYLFDPKKGKTYKKNDDHLALITELIGECKDLRYMKSQEAFEYFYTPKGKLKRVKSFKFWPLVTVLTDKYKLTHIDAYFLSRFLLKMLKWNPKERASAQEMLEDPWLKMPPEYDTFMGKTYFKEWKRATDKEYESSSSSESEGEGEDESGRDAGSVNNDDVTDEMGSEDGDDSSDLADEEAKGERQNKSV